MAHCAGSPSCIPSVPLTPFQTTLWPPSKCLLTLSGFCCCSHNFLGLHSLSSPFFSAALPPMPSVLPQTFSQALWSFLTSLSFSYPLSFSCYSLAVCFTFPKSTPLSPSFKPPCSSLFSQGKTERVSWTRSVVMSYRKGLHKGNK